jgi:nitrogen regulatory protein P-II 1
MKEIKAIIRDHRLDAVLSALHTHPDLPGVTVSVVEGFGRTVGRPDEADNGPAQFGTVQMTKVECVINDEQLDSVLELIQQAAHTGQPGDGKIAVYDVREIVRIRTGKRGTRVE